MKSSITSVLTLHPKELALGSFSRQTQAASYLGSLAPQARLGTSTIHRSGSGNSISSSFIFFVVIVAGTMKIFGRRSSCE
jgi:hypothetical protein